MPVLDDRTRGKVGELFDRLNGRVRLVFFERTIGCETCPEARGLVEEVVSLSDKLDLEVRNAEIDQDRAAELRIDRVPALAVLAGEDRGIRFYGTPSGYEFGTLIETIQDLSAGRIDLRPETIEGLKALRSPVHIQVFVTPT
jgi:alkyl hydroperoxide reductase subunit AhpF